MAPLLELKGIGKIYVSDSNVSVGIRGVNLAFDRGEFVAITGKSGSGKSTLLNVISGMDTYEEGELYIEGEPTSHYMQKDWEEYRKQYISFIFQDYNILESFTVLQNVELALMHIENPRERREKAMELLRRVGMEKHIRHKGSKLSGGQKQRTVIARALAKDSPIILADEPTGNLDSQSSAEIIELLREVSKDKLVIVVTHNFEQVEACATRHIRIYDGAVESDHRVRPAESVSDSAVVRTNTPTVAEKAVHTLRNGLHLGRVRFAATPKLSVFLCILMTLTSLLITVMSSVSYDAKGLFDKTEMFTHLDGRTVIVRQDGAIITDEELKNLASDVGAEDYMHYDFMLDKTVGVRIGQNWYDFSFGYPAADVKLDAGRYPKTDNEIILEVPVSLKPYLGGDNFTETELPLLFDMANYTVVGVKYYYDNTRTPRMLFTENGYKIASAITFFSEQRYNFSYDVAIRDSKTGENLGLNFTFNDTVVDYGLEPGSFYINSSTYAKSLKQLAENGYTRDGLDIAVTLSGSFVTYEYDYDYEYMYSYDVVYEPSYGSEQSVSYPFSDKSYRAVWNVSEEMRTALEERYYQEWAPDQGGIPEASFIVISPDILTDFLYEHYYAKSYTQASLFFADDREAHDKVEALRSLGYIAVVSDETVEPDVMTLLMNRLSAVFSAAGWLLSVAFASLFLSLCSSRAMNATKGDIAIMRSMGIPTGVIKVSIYIQTMIALIPAAVVTAAACIAVYTIPKTNYFFPFLHTGDYLLIAAILILIALDLSRRYVRKMFSESVKKTLRPEKGGSKA